MIFLDMDGVLADFDKALELRGIENLTHFIHKPFDEWTDEERALDVKVREHMEREDFWPHIPIKPGAHELIAASATRRPTFILTATPRNSPTRERIGRQKIAWARDILHFPVHRIIVCERHEKKNFANVGRILVDDMAANCEEWATYNGTPIHYTDLDKTLEVIKQL